MKVLVTGAGGFVGKELVKQLLDAGHVVTATDRSADGIPDGAHIIGGDLGDPVVRAATLSGGCDAIIHLATVPGGAAEADPAASRRINVDAMYDLLLEASALGNCPRFVFASSIAVLGDPMPSYVDDHTPLAPRMIYGGHKAMMEQAVAMFSHRSLIDGVSIRLPGILARPAGDATMKSAFMSNLFHALKAGEEFVCPVSAEATIWVQSLSSCVGNFLHALQLDMPTLPTNRAVTLPALRVTMGDLAGEIARQCGVSSALVRYDPDALLEAGFGRQPPLSTPAADRAGFTHDGDIENLVRSALARI